MKMASLLNLSSPFSIFFKNFYKTLVSNSLRRIISWLFVVYPLPSRLRPRVEQRQLHRAAGFVSGLGRGRKVPDDLSAVRLTTAANGNDSGPFVGVSRRQAPHAKATRRCARQINALPIHRILPNDLLQDGHDALAILRIGLPGTRLRLREENEHVERLLPLSDKRPRPIGRWFVAIHAPRAVAVQIHQQRIGPISLVFRRNKERVLPLDLLRVLVNALNEAGARPGHNEVTHNPCKQGEARHAKELLHRHPRIIGIDPVSSLALWDQS